MRAFCNISSSNVVPSDQAGYMLHDLPITKPRSTYMKDSEGKLVLTKEGVPSDKLSFPLFKLECAAMQSINYVILEEA
jgi:hypothetical protein